MPDTKSPYWKIFNALGRFVGAVFILVGSVILVSGAVQRDWIIASSGFVFVVLGVLLLFARPSYPDATN
jgi:hypothetical protein